MRSMTPVLSLPSTSFCSTVPSVPITFAMSWLLNLHSAHCRKGRCGRLGPLIFQTTVSANFGHRAIGQAFTPVMRTVDSSHSLTPHRSIVDGHGLPDTFPV